ncbi:hypothetical protein BB561_006408 [Smittium simulii]|uniref:PUM-HD domain-containing protein n=1 Tax=Smittium simulii TaxID=133385 RepID=A0A2T9Y4K2_9FUNG|nr:hypothetical protein BB561_006408 [Smittium simulii]
MQASLKNMVSQQSIKTEPLISATINSEISFSDNLKPSRDQLSNSTHTQNEDSALLLDYSDSLKTTPNLAQLTEDQSSQAVNSMYNQVSNNENNMIDIAKTDSYNRSLHTRARSYGTSLLDVLNDRANNSNSPNKIHSHTSMIFNHSPTLFDNSAANSLKPTSSVNNIIDISSDQNACPSRSSENVNGQTPSSAINNNFTGSVTRISNESIFGFSSNNHPPPGLDESLSGQSNFYSNSSNTPVDSASNGYSPSTLLRGTLNGNNYSFPLNRLQNSSANISLGRVKQSMLGNTISPELQSEQYWSTSNKTPESNLSSSNQPSSRNFSQVFQPLNGDDIPPVPQLPDLASLNLNNNGNFEVGSGNLVSRGASVPDTWAHKKSNDDNILNYSLDSSGNKSQNANEVLMNSNLFNNNTSKPELGFRTHSRSRTLGNALDSISSGLYGSSLYANNDIKQFSGHLKNMSISGIASLDADINSNDYNICDEFDESLAKDGFGLSQNRHFRQASLGFLGLGRHIGMEKISPSYSSSNLTRIKRGESDASIIGLSNFSSVGRAGTSSLIHGVRPNGSHHISSLSTSGSINVSSELAPTRSLWIGNLEIDITPRDLIEHFGKFGRIESLRTLPDKECAFVNFMRLEDAMRAHDEMQGIQIKNSIIRVGYGKGEGYATSDAQAMQPTRALWVGNISSTTTPSSLRVFFENFGVVESARILGQKSCGFVNFERLEDAVRAKQATNGRELDGMVVRIGYAKVPVRGTEGFTRPRNQVPVAPPLTASGRIAEANAIVGTSTSGLGNEDALEPGVPVMDEALVAFSYATSLPILPTPDTINGLGQTRLREIRKRLDTQCSQNEFDSLFKEAISNIVDLCSDYVGNMLVQKLVERGSFDQKMQIVKAVAPHIASIGVHKNGTWAIQKIIECANAKDHQEVIIEATRPYIPQLLLDQLGNYVVQCCLSFPENRNQFIFDSIHARSWDVAQGRFGARAIRTCLEHANTTRVQQKLIAVVLVLNAVALSTNANGNILITWLLDFSNFPGRFRVIAPQLAGHLRYLCTHKLGSTTILKIIDQREEPDARDLILNTLFFNPEPQVLDDILSDQVHGASVVYKVLCSSCVDDSEKIRIASRVKSSLLPLLQQGVQGYQKLNEVVDSILLNPNLNNVSEPINNNLLPISEYIDNHSLSKNMNEIQYQQSGLNGNGLYSKLSTMQSQMSSITANSDIINLQNYGFDLNNSFNVNDTIANNTFSNQNLNEQVSNSTLNAGSGISIENNSFNEFSSEVSSSQHKPLVNSDDNILENGIEN